MRRLSQPSPHFPHWCRAAGIVFPPGAGINCVYCGRSACVQSFSGDSEVCAGVLHRRIVARGGRPRLVGRAARHAALTPDSDREIGLAEPVELRTVWRIPSWGCSSSTVRPPFPVAYRDVRHVMGLTRKAIKASRLAVRDQEHDHESQFFLHILVVGNHYPS